jgi:hypothetical protein
MSDETVPICSLFALYKHFSSEARQEIEKKKAQTRKIISKASSTESAKKDKLIPRHINPITHPRSTVFLRCPQCDCEGTVVDIHTAGADELAAKTEAWEEDYAEKKKKNPKACRTGEPQEEYACMCPKSKTMLGDWRNSSCLVCRKKGAEKGMADPNCKNCNCNCPDEVFTQGQAQQKAITGLMQRNNEAKAKSNAKDGGAILGSIIKESVGAVTDRLRETKGVLPNNKHVISLVADQLKHKQFASEEDMHTVQQMMGAPTTKLVSGEDARSVSTQRNKKEYQNSLR